MSMKNIIPDLSHYNEEIDWDKAAEQCPFVILRASVGLNTDSRYLEFASAAYVRKIPYHAYHYLKATTADDAKAEAQVFYNMVSQLPRPLYWIIDCEYKEISEMTLIYPGLARRVVDAFEDELRRLAGADIKVACYIGGNNYKKWDLDYGKYAYLWIPRYGADDGEPHEEPAYPCDLWQYTSNGRVDFVSDDVDLNKMMGDKPLSFFTGREETNMEKVFTNIEHAAWLLEQARLKRPYWYGVYHLPCTEELLQKKRKQYPDHYTDKRMDRYREDIAAGQIAGDCVNGAIKGAVWGELGKRNPVYQSHDCPDKSADGMFEYCKKIGMAWGEMESMPDVPGVAVRMKGHVGVYVGNGEVVEWRGFDYGCVVTKLDKRKWLNWYMLPWTEYVDEDGQISSKLKLGDRTLRKGDTGEDVREMQELLLEAGHDPQGADGDFGSNTEKAVMSFQAEHGLTADGIYGAKTHRALFDALAEPEDEVTYILMIMGTKDGLDAIRAEHGGEMARMM